MTEITDEAGSKNAAAKPRISLLSLKQSTRLKSEDSLTDQSLHMNSQNSTVCSNRTGDHVAGPSTSNTRDESASDQSISSYRNGSTSELTNGRLGLSAASEASVDELVSKHVTPSRSRGETKHSESEKTSVCKEDLIRLLSMMKSELQSKEITIASMKLEQLKRLMNPVEISRSDLASTYIELQDRLEAKTRCLSGNEPQCVNSNENSSALHGMKSSTNGDNELPRKNDGKGGESRFDRDEENLTLLSTLLELLDRHPLLALPRDSIYCLDYTCNELSTKNYLNLKIQQLENLIEQHRRFRYFIGERLKRSEQRYLNLTLKLEHEKNLRLESERADHKLGGKATLLKHIEQIKEALEKEKASKRAIVMTLLNELLDERERNEKLSQRILELEGKLSNSTTTKPTQVKYQQSSPTAGQPKVCKPRVPAKPAQLLDRQRSQTNIR